MSARMRMVGSLLAPALFVTLIAAIVLWAPTSSAQTSTPEEPQADETATGDEPGAKAQEPSSQDRKQQRIEEYLRKREERRARKDLNRQNRETREPEEDAATVESEQLAAAAAAAEAVPEAVPLEEPTTEMTPAPSAKKKSKRRNAPRHASSLPRDLARVQANVRLTHLAQDPTVQEYLVMIEEQRASPHQLAAFGSFLAQNGMVREALEYYDVALRIERSDPLLWINAGTLQLKSANLSAAATSFSRALTLDPNSAMAHYNLGSTLKEMNKYEDAVMEYKIALALDPALGDPARNPSAAYNDLLTAVKLLLYQEQSGSLSLPLLDVETGRMLTLGSEAENR